MYGFACQNRYDDLLQLVPEYEKAIARFEKAAGRAQPEARGNLYIALMNTYIDIREYDKAEPYLTKIEGLVNNDISRFELLRARALILRRAETTASACRCGQCHDPAAGG